MPSAQVLTRGGHHNRATGLHATIHFSAPFVWARLAISVGGVAPAGLDRSNSGHHHLLIDTDLPPLNQRLSNDFNQLHFGAGQTEAQVQPIASSARMEVESHTS
jgi:hypothetical protein